MSALLSEPFQMMIRGIVCGGDQCDPYPVTEFLSGFGIPGVRSNPVDRPGRDGQVPGPQFMKARTLTVAVGVVGDSTIEVQTLTAGLVSAWNRVGDQDLGLAIPLYFTLADPGQVFVAYGQPQRAASGYAMLWRAQHANAAKPFTDAVVCEFLATDPLFYSADPTSIMVGSSVALAQSVPLPPPVGSVGLAGWAGLQWTVRQ